MSIIGRLQPYRMARPKFERFKTTSAQMDFVRKHYFGKLAPSEVALIITRFPHEERMGSTASNVFGDTIHETLYLGILPKKGPLTAYEDGQSPLADDVRICTEKYYSPFRGYQSKGVQCGPIRLSSMDFHRLGDSIAEPIRAWWQDHHSPWGRHFCEDEHGKAIGVYPIEVAVGHEEIQRLCEKGENYRYFYIIACNALGLTPALSPALAKHARIERAKIIYKMIELLDKIGIRSARIDRVTEAAGPGQTIMDGGALTILESKDDAFWVTFGDRQRRSEEARELARLLESAKGFGMSTESEERVPHPYHPGAEIIAGQFIAAIEKIAAQSKR